MPTILRVGRYRFHFFSNEGQEPAHIHVKAGNEQAKSWLDPIILAANYGFEVYELDEIKTIIVHHKTKLIEAWNEHFD